MLPERDVLGWVVVNAGQARLRRVVSRSETQLAVALAKEYGEWSVRVAKTEYGIDAEAESELGLSTSIEELLQPRGRLYLAEVRDIAVGLGGLKPVTDELGEIKRMYVRPSARGLGLGRALLHN